MPRWAVLLVVAAFPASAAPLVLEGEAPAEGDFFTLPFDVPPGTAELEVRHDDLSSANILDWGLLAPDGAFRGWGGGNPEPAVVGVTSSSRSYLTGPIAPGTWRVLVGKAHVPQAPAKYRVEIELRPAPTLGAQERAPYAHAAPLEPTRRWYAGDLHVHSVESGDARPSLDEIAATARARGLDFIAVSDHNTVSQLDFYAGAQARHPKLLLAPSVEFTTYRGHLGAFGATRFVPFWMGFEGASLKGALQAYAAQGAVVTLNHPTLDLGTFCIGCAWEHPLPSDFRGAIEVGVGGLDETGVLFDLSALAYWEALADRGLHLAAVGGSDDHKAGAGSNQTQSLMGSPTTLLDAESLSVPALVEALEAGRSVVKLRGPDDPMVVLDPPAALQRTADTLAGARAVIRATVKGGAGASLAWIENGNLAREVHIDADPFTAQFELTAEPGTSARLRAEVRLGGHPRTVTSHLWLSPDSPPGPPVQSRAPRAAGCLGCASAGGMAGFVLLALALRLGLRPRSGRAAR